MKGKNMPNKPPGWKELHEYQHPGNVKVRLSLFWTKNVSGDPAPALVDKADAMLKEHGLSLDVYASKYKQTSMTLDFTDELLGQDQLAELRMLAHKTFDDKGKPPRLPVIFCPFAKQSGAEKCDVNGMVVTNTDWLPFVVINSNSSNPDKVTLLHEIGHAAKLVHIPKGKDDVVVNFMSWEQDRTGMLRNQVISIARAYFSG